MLLSSRVIVSCALAVAVTFASAPRANACQRDLDDAQIKDRLEMLEGALGAIESPGSRWWWTWTGVYAGLTFGTGLLASLTSNEELQERAYVAAGDSFVNLALHTLVPYSPSEGAKSIMGMPVDTKVERVRKLGAAEEALETASAHAQIRGAWYQHVATVAIGGSSTAVIAAGFDQKFPIALSFGLLSIATGEARIWLTPDEPEDLWAAYTKKYPERVCSATDEVQSNLQIIPTGNGVMVRW